MNKIKDIVNNVLVKLGLAPSDNDKRIREMVDKASPNVRIVGNQTVIRDYSDLDEETLDQHRKLTKVLVENNERYKKDE